MSRNSQSSLPRSPSRSATPQSHACQSLPICGFISATSPLPQSLLPLRSLCPLCFISAYFTLLQLPVFSVSYKRVRNSLKISTFKSLYFQAVAHSLSLFSCKSFICNHVSKTTGGYTPKLSDSGIFAPMHARHSLATPRSCRAAPREGGPLSFFSLPPCLPASFPPSTRNPFLQSPRRVRVTT